MLFQQGLADPARQGFARHGHDHGVNVGGLVIEYRQGGGLQYPPVGFPMLVRLDHMFAIHLAHHDPGAGFQDLYHLAVDAVHRGLAADQGFQ